MTNRDEEQRGGFYDDERAAKSDAINYLGLVPKDPAELMARTRLNRKQVITLTMQEVQEQALNPYRKIRLLSEVFRITLARNLYALDGQWRLEMGAILQTQSEERAANAAFRE